jgi:hypothetical protein
VIKGGLGLLSRPRSLCARGILKTESSRLGRGLSEYVNSAGVSDSSVLALDHTQNNMSKEKIVA